MIRPILLATIVGFSSVGGASADETYIKQYGLHLLSNGCPFIFSRLDPMPRPLIAGVFERSRCGGGQDIGVEGVIIKSSAILYENTGGYLWVWRFQWPLQEGGWWEQELCEATCIIEYSGTYGLGPPH